MPWPGFRSSFKDWARHEGVDELLSEFALAHVKGSKTVGGYPGTNHRMPMCCNVMYAEMVEGADEVLSGSPSGQGASVAIEYLLPRPGAHAD